MKKYYRICHRETLQGLWYDFNGNFTGLIHDKFTFCMNTKLEMEFDETIVGWLSAVEKLHELFQWFSHDDIRQLQKHGWFIHEFEADEVMFYDRFKHLVIKQDNARVLRIIEIDLINQND